MITAVPRGREQTGVNARAITGDGGAFENACTLVASGVSFTAMSSAEISLSKNRSKRA